MGARRAAPVFCRLNVDDGAAQVEVTLAGRTKPLILRPDAVVTVAAPLWSNPSPRSDEEARSTMDNTRCIGMVASFNQVYKRCYNASRNTYHRTE